MMAAARLRGQAVDDLLTAPGFFSDPYPAYRVLREAAPVVWSEAWGGWVLTRYADVAAVLRDHKRYSSAGRIHFLLDRLPDDTRAETGLLEAHYQVGIAHMDPPAHTRLRALVAPWFTPRLLEAWRPRIRVLAAELVQAAAARPSLDLMRDVAYPLPAYVVLEMLGAPREDSDLLRDWALDINLLFSGGGRTTVASVRRAQASLAEMRAYIGALVAARRRTPSDDLLGRLVAAEAEGDRLNDAELVSTCVTLFVAGHETTTNLLGNGLIALLRHPEQMAHLRQAPALMESAVEEMLRYDAPVHRSWRIAREDAEIDGQPIRRGDMLLLMIGAAHRDPAAFPDPEAFDIARRENKHLGFGVGIHFCLGAPLARIEVPEALTAILQRWPSLRLLDAPPLQWRQDIALRGVEALPVAPDTAPIREGIPG
jgi:cytochrome P450